VSLSKEALITSLSGFQWDIYRTNLIIAHISVSLNHSQVQASQITYHNRDIQSPCCKLILSSMFYCSFPVNSHFLFYRHLLHILFLFLLKSLSCPMGRIDEIR
jgi:hypothetical protein